MLEALSPSKLPEPPAPPAQSVSENGENVMDPSNKGKFPDVEVVEVNITPPGKADPDKDQHLQEEPLPFPLSPHQLHALDSEHATDTNAESQVDALPEGESAEMIVNKKKVKKQKISALMARFEPKDGQTDNTQAVELLVFPGVKKKKHPASKGTTPMFSPDNSIAPEAEKSVKPAAARGGATRGQNALEAIGSMFRGSIGAKSSEKNTSKTAETKNTAPQAKKSLDGLLSELSAQPSVATADQEHAQWVNGKENQTLGKETDVQQATEQRKAELGIVQNKQKLPLDGSKLQLEIETRATLDKSQEELHEDEVSSSQTGVMGTGELGCSSLSGGLAPSARGM
eukprot:gb/GEZN01009956.1/.p1 GENE.gb/GEZN01009956.1/~~gb/GEZN01009956.1/.p1  ORF type:complete len:342 (-),score=76.07 gb/GEZN01009956.1/:68-1093(-)